MQFLMILRPGQTVEPHPHVTVKNGAVYEDIDVVLDFSDLSSRELLDNGLCVTKMLRGQYTGLFYADFITNGRRVITERLASELMAKSIRRIT